MPILAGSGQESVVELAGSTTESDDSTTDFKIIGRLSVLNMFIILNPLESADSCWPTIRVRRREICLVGTGLNDPVSRAIMVQSDPVIMMPNLYIMLSLPHAAHSAVLMEKCLDIQPISTVGYSISNGNSALRGI